MESSHYRKIELQSPADFSYLHTNAVTLSRQKLDLHLPPSTNPNDGPDPMRERVRELVDEFITRTFASASSSVSINGLDSSSPEFPFPASFTEPAETVEYEAYDTDLAARVTSLYAQLESLTTTVAQLRRDAPGKAAKLYAEELKKSIEKEDEDEDEDEEEEEEEEEEEDLNRKDSEQGEHKGKDVDMLDADADADADAQSKPSSSEPDSKRHRKHLRKQRNAAKWNLDIPLGTEKEAERWRNGEVAEVYEDALRTLLRLQGEGVSNNGAVCKSDGMDGNALASTVGKAERARRAVEFVETA
ncbi:hypothetical protein P175DRAFT_0486860 [Aspergillus ochraceoroseus IBT 24754]|uniref:Kinetochore protein mis14 n=3 Tax=Aspergillus subgen. Nidulantes TaxID=2720870 RepID=A0A2T5LMA8_9EURO|nr:uncharacterized protein P175DRAFT_0486860 [Aspergillus ochraceoroseus IBT 24754]PTU17411.1 hypothetical protein P175DRAFT_0486860 [Aspergillus ochraceoroseus IBT 24754]